MSRTAMDDDQPQVFSCAETTERLKNIEKYIFFSSGCQTKRHHELQLQAECGLPAGFKVKQQLKAFYGGMRW